MSIKPNKFLRNLSSKLLIPSPQPTNSFVSKSNRDAALRERGLLPPLPQKDLSQLEHELDRQLDQDRDPASLHSNDPNTGTDTGTETEAERIMKQWKSKNVHDAQQHQHQSDTPVNGHPSPSVHDDHAHSPSQSPPPLPVPVISPNASEPLNNSPTDLASSPLDHPSSPLQDPSSDHSTQDQSPPPQEQELHPKQPLALNITPDATHSPSQLPSPPSSATDNVFPTTSTSASVSAPSPEITPKELVNTHEHAPKLPFISLSPPDSPRSPESAHSAPPASLPPTLSLRSRSRSPHSPSSPSAPLTTTNAHNHHTRSKSSPTLPSLAESDSSALESSILTPPSSFDDTHISPNANAATTTNAKDGPPRLSLRLHLGDFDFSGISVIMESPVEVDDDEGNNSDCDRPASLAPPPEAEMGKLAVVEEIVEEDSEDVPDPEDSVPVPVPVPEPEPVTVNATTEAAEPGPEPRSESDSDSDSDSDLSLSRSPSPSPPPPPIARKRQRGATDPGVVPERRRSGLLFFGKKEKGASMMVESTPEPTAKVTKTVKTPPSPPPPVVVPPSAGTVRARAFSSLRRSVVGNFNTLSRAKETVLRIPTSASASSAAAASGSRSPTLPAHTPPPSSFSRSFMVGGRTPRSPRSPTFDTRSSLSSSSASAGAQRQALDVTIHSPASILMHTSKIEDEESRRLSEMAFLT